MTDIAKLRISMETDGVEKAKKELDGLDKSTKGAGKSADSFVGSIGKMVSAATIAGLAFKAVQFGADFLKQSEAAANEAAMGMAKMEAVLRATDHASGMTSKSIMELAEKLSLLSGVDDEAIVSAEALMLTFKRIGEDVFPRAMQAALDMSTTFGGLESATLMLSKALDSPVEGVTALQRAGVRLTDAQKENIEALVEMGKVAQAQNIILSEVESQVGGTAAAVNEASDGSNNLKVAYGNLQETVGAKLLPGTKAFNALLTYQLNALKFGVEALDDNKVAMQRQSTEVIKTTKSYDDYVIGMLEAKKEIKGLTSSEGEMLAFMRDQGNTLQSLTDNSINYSWALNKLTGHYGILTEAEFEAAKGQQAILETGTSVLNFWDMYAPATEQAAIATKEAAQSAEEAAAALEAERVIFEGFVSALYNSANAADYFADRFNNLIYNLAVDPEQLKAIGEMMDKLFFKGEIDTGQLLGGNALLGIEAITRAFDEGILSRKDALDQMMDGFGISAADAADYLSGARDAMSELSALMFGVPSDTFEAVLDDISSLAVQSGLTEDYLLGVYAQLMLIDGKNVNASVTIRSNTVGSASIGYMEQQAGVDLNGNGIVGNATGGEYLVSSPTMFLGGEAGKEKVTFTPLGSENTNYDNQAALIAELRMLPVAIGNAVVNAQVVAEANR